MYNPWSARPWTTSGVELYRENKRVAVLDFNPEGRGAMYDDELKFILSALNEKETRDRPRDETQ